MMPMDKVLADQMDGKVRVQPIRVGWLVTVNCLSRRCRTEEALARHLDTLAAMGYEDVVLIAREETRDA